MEKENVGQTKIFRLFSWILSLVGHQLLVSPIIQMLSFIPLIGAALAYTFNIASFIFAVVWSTILHFTIMGTSWLFYRPLYGMTLLAGVCLIILTMWNGEVILTKILNRMGFDDDSN